MSDALEELLTSRLHALGETVDEEVLPPVDLELQVARRRKHERVTRRWAALGIAATIVAVVASVAVARGETGTDSLRIDASPTTVAPVHDALQPGTVMLSARGRFVVSLDENGRTNATMVKTERSDVDVKYARATDDHRELWYLSVRRNTNACGNVVRADIEGQTSTIVARATMFDVSPDGSRLALYGAGDLAHDRCTPVANGAPGHVVVLDLENRSSTSRAMKNVTSLRWAPDGSYLVAVTCPANGCEVVRANTGPGKLGTSLELAGPNPLAFLGSSIHSAKVAFGPGGLYILQTVTPGPRPSSTTQLLQVDPNARDNVHGVTVFGSYDWDVTQVIPTGATTYVVAAPTRSNDFGLYRVRSGRPGTLVLVRPLDNPGTFTPVPPLTNSR